MMFQWFFSLFASVHEPCIIPILKKEIEKSKPVSPSKLPRDLFLAAPNERLERRSGARLCHLDRRLCALCSWNQWNLCKISVDWHPLFDVSRKRGLFVPHSFTFYLICSSLCSPSISFEAKQIHQPLNKQELCGNHKTIAKGSYTFFTLTSVFFSWLSLFFFWLDFCLTCLLTAFGRALCDCNYHHWFLLSLALIPSNHTVTWRLFVLIPSPAGRLTVCPIFFGNSCRKVCLNVQTQIWQYFLCFTNLKNYVLICCFWTQVGFFLHS